MTHWVLLGSPFLGPEVWRPVACLLATSTVVAGSGDDPATVLASYVAGMPDADDLVLVPHSNAGLYVAALAERATGIVFVDALLPGPAVTTPVTSPALAAALTPLAGPDGRLPGWTGWWSEEDVAGMFPDPASRAAIEVGQPRVRASYLVEEVPTPSGWERLPCAYLGFGDAYAEEVAQARAARWPVAVEPGLHLHPLVDPGAVAGRIVALTGARPD